MTNTVKIQVRPSSESFKVLEINGQEGDQLKQHKVSHNALLLVQQGNIRYKEENVEQHLSAGEVKDIPAEVLHEVQCMSTATFWVILSPPAQLKF